MTDAADDLDLPEQMRVRLDKRERLLALGRDPYPVRLPVTHAIGEIRAAHVGLEPDTATGEQVGVAGRVIFKRDTGKLCFATLRAGDGAEIQAMLSLASVGEVALEEWKQLVDIGDHVVVVGEVITSRRGELSVMAGAWHMATKALRPLPVAHRPLSEENRVRQRYVDLIVRPEARHMARTRVLAEASLRTSLAARGYLEIETPILQVQQGGATARPFVTRSHAFDMDLFLRIAPELFLKRALVGGLERVFEINRNFRNEGVSTRHNPEFTMLEFYQAYAEYHELMDLTEEMLRGLAREFSEDGIIEYQGQQIDFGRPFRRLSVRDAIIEYNPGLDPAVLDDSSRLAEVLRGMRIKVNDGWGLGKLQLELFEATVEEKLLDPTFIIAYPTEVSPLARRNDADPEVTDRFELFIAGREIANGFTELNDPEDQAERFHQQLAARHAGDDEAMLFDADYIRALEHGMPPTAGEGIGIDRLVMLFTNSASIRDVLLFPLMKPET